MGNVRTSSVPRWKVRVDFLFTIIKLFYLPLRADALICRNQLC